MQRRSNADSIIYSGSARLSNLVFVLPYSLATRRSLLTQTTAATSPLRARPIYKSPGYTLHKPQKSMGSMLLISCLLAAQVLALAYLARYIYLVPTSTPGLDAEAAAGLTAGSEDPDPDLSPASSTRNDRPPSRRLDETSEPSGSHGTGEGGLPPPRSTRQEILQMAKDKNMEPEILLRAKDSLFKSSGAEVKDTTQTLLRERMTRTEEEQS